MPHERISTIGNIVSGEIRPRLPTEHSKSRDHRGFITLIHVAQEC